MPRINILIAAMLATATSAGGYDLQSPATREKATDECVLDYIKDSVAPLAGLRAYCQSTVEEMAKQLTVQEMNKYGGAVALPHGRMPAKGWKSVSRAQGLGSG